MRIVCLALAAVIGGAAPALAEEAGTPHPPAQRWSFSGPFGTFDRAQLQRGYQVYREVCATCHSMNLLSYRNLMQAGGPEFSETQAKAMAASAQIAFTNDQGERAERPGELSDRFRNPYPNLQAAIYANNGKAPPDLSVMAKARGYERGFPWFILDAVTGFNNDQGPNYIYALLTGYHDPPAGTPAQEGLNYNEYFPGHWIGMPNILRDEAVTYADGSPQTVSQYARDVTAFLMWAAEPHLEARKRIGFQVMVFLVLFAGLVYYTKRKVWRAVH